MKVGVIGLGKMGSQIVKRFLQFSHEVIVFDSNSEAINALAMEGSTAANSMNELVRNLGEKPVIWLMIPSQYTGDEISALCKLLPKGTIIIDGGNSDFRLTMKRSKECQNAGISLVDVGVSGGIHGLKHGFSMMIGGDKNDVEQIMPLIKTLGQKGGYAHFGPTGAGHFVKMVHNASEYGMMQSLAEGYNLLKEGPFDSIDLRKVAEVWQHGSVVRSWLNELCAEILTEDSKLDAIDGVVAESGEARWALETAHSNNIDMPAIQASFNVRVESQQGKINFSTKLLSAMRNKFGGHEINPK